MLFDHTYHPDHLGSAAWITDKYGLSVQYMMYAPYGELLLNQQAGTYDERFKFTGKERDEETGYLHFDARNFSDILGNWLSVDPLADKYIDISPYVYCNGNPIAFVDPDGRKVVGHSENDIETFVQDIGDILKDSKFDGYRGLIKQEGNRIRKISRQDYKTWKASVELSADEECYVDLLTAVINSHQTCTIEYLENDLCTMSIQADTYLSEK